MPSTCCHVTGPVPSGVADPPNRGGRGHAKEVGEEGRSEFGGEVQQDGVAGLPRVDPIGAEAQTESVRRDGPPRAGQGGRDWLAQALDDIGALGLRHGGNYRYAWAIGDRARRRRTGIVTAALPYPKRVDA